MGKGKLNIPRISRHQEVFVREIRPLSRFILEHSRYFTPARVTNNSRNAAARGPPISLEIDVDLLQVRMSIAELASPVRSIYMGECREYVWGKK